MLQLHSIYNITLQKTQTKQIESQHRVAVVENKHPILHILKFVSSL